MSRYIVWLILAVPVLDELVNAIPSIVVLLYLQVVVKSLVNGFDAGLDSVANYICYTFYSLFWIVKNDNRDWHIMTHADMR